MNREAELLSLLATTRADLTALRASTAAAQQAALTPCVWQEDYEGVWYSRCGEAFVLLEGSPADNDYHFCPACGHPLHMQPCAPWTADELAAAEVAAEELGAVLAAAARVA